MTYVILLYHFACLFKSTRLLHNFIWNQSYFEFNSKIQKRLKRHGGLLEKHSSGFLS